MAVTADIALCLPLLIGKLPAFGWVADAALRAIHAVVSRLWCAVLGSVAVDQRHPQRTVIRDIGCGASEVDVQPCIVGAAAAQVQSAILEWVSARVAGREVATRGGLRDGAQVGRKRVDPSTRWRWRGLGCLPSGRS